MGYDTYFTGSITVQPPLPDEWVKTFNAWQQKGPYKAPDIERGYCGWMLAQQDEMATLIDWDQGGSFYSYTEWLQYVVNRIKNDFPDRIFSGEIRWDGDENDDIGMLRVTPDGKVSCHPATITFD